jgi:hypothetical protein
MVMRASSLGSARRWFEKVRRIFKKRDDKGCCVRTEKPGQFVWLKRPFAGWAGCIFALTAGARLTCKDLGKGDLMLSRWLWRRSGRAVRSRMRVRKNSQIFKERHDAILGSHRNTKGMSCRADHPLLFQIKEVRGAVQDKRQGSGVRKYRPPSVSLSPSKIDRPQPLRHE